MNTPIIDRTALPLDAFAATSLEQAITLPASLYVSDAAHQLDKAAIFLRSWQCVGHQSMLPNNGDVLVTEVADKPIIVVRNHQGELTAFYNVCKHRAGPLVLESGNVKVLSCRYHGWSYQLDGQLRTAPEMADTPNFNPCEVHLDKVALASWQGYLFINLAAEPQPIDELFAGIQSRIAPIDLEQMQFHHRDEYTVACNWKVYMDNYLEGYHLPHVHPGLNKLLDYKSYTTELAKWYSYQYSPLESQQSFYGEGAAHYFCVYPNLMLNILPGRCQINIIVPLSATTCKVIFDYYYSDLNAPEVQAMIKQDLSFSDEVQDEDISICEHVQKGLASGVYDQGRLCVRREQGVWHYQELLRRGYRTFLL
ncbi:MAG: aromatic ring-hydroxylating dioxygenase subunit alpha [Gammaproteobacteria bacterium]|nr:aromatic ring-hydroxylating dioxygenase subunit alpha [Gammaproteobacteria bacterium]NVK88579.1 aromatic ring-hydroxylating dioxygenase subunit alpha [Gammaproteobacteria bacterium]